MKTRNLFLIVLCLMTSFGFAQKKGQYTRDDAKQFYRTIQGDYRSIVNDSTSVSMHFTPVWEDEDNPFRWIYMEISNDSTKQIIDQKILEIKPISEKTFKVIVHGIKNAETFAGKWRNRNFFDGYTTHILKGSKRFIFTKTKDFEYQTSLVRPKNLSCFSKGDTVHFKFTQSDERLYVKRLFKRSSNIEGYLFLKDVTDALH